MRCDHDNNSPMTCLWRRIDSARQRSIQNYLEFFHEGSSILPAIDRARPAISTLRPTVIQEMEIAMRGLIQARGTSLVKVFGAALAAIAAISPRALNAADGTWLNIGYVNGNWSNAGNWFMGVVPGSTSSSTNADSAQFGGPNNAVTVDANRNLYDIDIRNNSNLSGGNLILTSSTLVTGQYPASGGIISHAPSVTVSSPISLGGGAGAGLYGLAAGNAFGGNNGNLTITGPISGSSPSGSKDELDLEGEGTGLVSGSISDGPNGGKLGVLMFREHGSTAGTGWTLSGNNTYTGDTATLGAPGTLTLQGPSAWGPALSGPGVTKINGGAVAFDYGGVSSADPASTIVSILAAGASTYFVSGQIQSAVTNGTSTSLGFVDTGSEAIVSYALFGDVNLDGTTDTVDFNIIAANWEFGSLGPSGVTPYTGLLNPWIKGDVNYDGKIDTRDFNALVASFGKTLSGSAAGEAVPEPACLGLFGALLLGRRTRRRF